MGVRRRAPRWKLRLAAGRVLWCAALLCIALACGSAPIALAGGDANENACPNEASSGFRSYLADCRAYEMVSPPFKDGFPIQAVGYTSGDIAGGAPLYGGSSLGAFASGPDIVEGAFGNDYLFRRSVEGWETIAIDPQPSQFVLNPNAARAREGGGALAVSEDGAALMQLHAPTESIFGSDLYMRSPGGALSLVGPMMPEGAFPAEPTGLQAPALTGLAFAGASPDLSRVLFYIHPALEEGASAPFNLWPGDSTIGATEASSLYEYAGTHNARPSLVGVTGPGEQISQCGVGLGGQQGANTHNAVSESAETVFFTASPQCPGNETTGPGSGPPAYEIFARLAGAPEHTTTISEPTPEECEGACAGIPVADANFEGASQDGSKAFFTSTQKLLADATEDHGTHEQEGEVKSDSAVENGGCQAAASSGGCNLYEYDLGAGEGHHLLLVSAGSASGAQVQGVAAVSEDGTHVYFVARGKLAGANVEGHEPREGEENLYLFERDERTAREGFAEGRTTFVATLSEADSEQWSRTGEAPMNVTPDGRFLVFTSVADLTADDTSSVKQVFRYDAQEGRLTRVSIGYDNDGNTSTFPAVIKTTALSTAQRVGIDTHPSVSSDGAIVVFRSSASLTPQAEAGVKSVYEYHDGHVYLVSDGHTNIGSPELFVGSTLDGVSASGSDIFFRTYGSLLPQDTDTLADVYDARVDGGFPTPSAPRGCSGDGCQSPPDSTPSLPAAQSAVQSAGENLPPPQPPPPKAKPKPLTRAQKLAKALAACRRKPKAKRAACRAQARRRYGSRRTAQKPARAASVREGNR